VNRLAAALIALSLVDSAPLCAQKRSQAVPPKTQPFGSEAFTASNNTTIRWLGNAGFFINSRGTTLMVDPLLKGFDMPLLFDMPIAPENVPRLDAVLITHRDNDHYSVPTCRALARVSSAYHSTQLVASLMKKEGLPATGHNIGDVFNVGQVRIKLTPADHNYRPGSKKEDDSGFWIETPDGTMWAPGDSRLMPEHLRMPPPDAIFFDFSDNEWHFGLEGAVKLANAYPHSALLLSHWGTVDAPNFTPFNGDPQVLYRRIVNPQRIRVLAPGAPYILTRVRSSRK
jgi:L-ascorbate metabolism protein UlaG (beta-lactamase superfamily)